MDSFSSYVREHAPPLWPFLSLSARGENDPAFRDGLIQVMRTGLWWSGATALVGVVAHVALVTTVLDDAVQWTYSTVPASGEIAIAYHVVVAIVGAALMLVASHVKSLSAGRATAGLAVLIICGASLHDDVLRGEPVSISFVVMIYLVGVVAVPFRPWQALAVGGGVVGIHALFTEAGVMVPDAVAEAISMQTAVPSLGMAMVLATAVSAVLQATRRAQHRVRRDAEQTLEESRDLLRRTQNVAKVGGWEYVPSTNTMYGTDAVHRIWGTSPGAILDLDAALDRHPPNARARVRSAMDAALDEDTSFDVEVPLITDAGTRKWVRIRGEPGSGGPRIGDPDPAPYDSPYLIGILQDITERRKLELQLRQAQTMESVGTLAGGIAHDFNNILHAAKAHLELAGDRLSSRHGARAFLDRTEEGLDQAEDLANKLLTFSRPNSTARRTRFDLADIVRDVLHLVEASLPDSVTLATRLSDGCAVHGDPDQLRQVVLNVVTNAMEAMENATPPASANTHRLEVRLSSTRVDADMAAQYLNLTPGTYVHLAVSDTGSGMDEATQERVFDPFFAAERSFGSETGAMNKASEKGTGLGLAVAYSAVDAHGGDIMLHSQPGEGTTVDVYLQPADATDDAADRTTPDPHDADPANPADPADPAPRVLVVDDEPSILDLEEIRLARFGYRPETCSSPGDALDRLAADVDGYDLLLTDQVMPAMTGVELTEILRSEGTSIPVVLMSGYGAQVDEEQVREAGIQAFVRKPVDSETLVETLQTVLRAG